MNEIKENEVPSEPMDPRRAREQINDAILGSSATDGEVEQSIAEALRTHDGPALIQAYDRVMAVLEPVQEESREFQPFHYEMSEEDLAKLRDFLADKRLEELRETGQLPSSLPTNREKPHFTLSNPEGDGRADFELYAASYLAGKAILLAHPEYNNGWGCALALGWTDRTGVAEVSCVEFSGYPEVIMSAMPLLEKYKIKDIK
jgi:hypothetical protein